MKKLKLSFVLSGLLLWGSAWAADANPNIIVIFADDMGVGDVSGLNPEGKIPTPHIDRMIDNGLALLNGHTTSSVCTPSRYGLLTGRYNWRSRRKAGVAGGFTGSEIAKGRSTLATMLKKAGYHTAMIGKWHLGLDWVMLPETEADPDSGGSKKKIPNVDYTKPFRGGPVDHGFDSWFGIAASLDMPPYVWLVDDRASEVPTVTKAFHRPGPAAESFEAIDVLPRLG
ncbi:MAG: sulfatase-like hydrolase/transferase, partial [Nitrospinaceae bacterium]|nr:sulfatase-like hydrolase/transferase [Nitrospinaceae bacterium]